MAEPPATDAADRLSTICCPVANNMASDAFTSQGFHECRSLGELDSPELHASSVVPSSIRLHPPRVASQRVDHLACGAPRRSPAAPSPRHAPAAAPSGGPDNLVIFIPIHTAQI